MQIEYHLEPFQKHIHNGLTALGEGQVIQRLWEGDHTLWDPDPQEITNRLGWLDIAERMGGHLPRIQSFLNELEEKGYRQALLMGMGGSSLAPEVFSLTFGHESAPLAVEILDSTDPAALREQTARLDPERATFIVATKSGTTVETLSFFKYFYNWTQDQLGPTDVGEHFAGITDPGSELVQLGERYHFRELFLNDPHIGGRYSALSFFGLVPAALAGVDIETLLGRAQKMMARCGPDRPVGENPGALLGNALGTLAEHGRDKVTFTTTPDIASYPSWIEQLLAESTGKSGQGILPIVGEPLGRPELYGEDRVFVNITTEDKITDQPLLEALRSQGHPLIEITLSDRYDLGGQFFLWEFATAVAGFQMGIHPFNQPNVESAKARAREMVQAYETEGALPEGDTSPLDWETLSRFITTHVQGGSYLALQAFIPPTLDNARLLNELRVKLRERFSLPTTVGFGPRFLHSTGQLHKGDAGKGLFIQFTSQADEDLPIPKEAGDASSKISFDTLKRAQALGDAQALRDRGRQVIRFSLGKRPQGRLAEFLRSSFTEQI